MSAEQEVPEQTLEERAATAYHEACGRHGYITEEGVIDPTRVADKLFEPVSKARADKLIERRVGLTRRKLVEIAFDDVPGPEAWDAEEDPELAEALYKRVDSLCWRQTNIHPDGPLQSRFNSELSVVMLRTKTNPDKLDAVYVTRSMSCIMADLYKKQKADQKARADREAALTAMLIERIPEHGKRFDRELVGGLRVALNSAKQISANALGVLETTDDADEPDFDEGESDE